MSFVKSVLLQTRQRKLLCIVLFALLLSFVGSVSGRVVLGQEAAEGVTTASSSPEELLPTQVFSISEPVMLSTRYTDQSTNIAFYIKCPNPACDGVGTPEFPVYIFSAENLGQGTKPLSDYWAPPALTDYVAVEYKNDTQQFSCSMVTLAECLADERFVSAMVFSVAADGVMVTPEMKQRLIADEARLFAGAQLITATSSLTADLSDGAIVTATLDAVTASPTAPQNEAAIDADDSHPVMDFIEAVVDFFVPGEQEPQEAAPVENATIPDEPVADEPPTLSDGLDEPEHVTTDF